MCLYILVSAYYIFVITVCIKLATCHDIFRPDPVSEGTMYRYFTIKGKSFMYFNVDSKNVNVNIISYTPVFSRCLYFRTTSCFNNFLGCLRNM